MQNNVSIKKITGNEYRISGTVLRLKDCSSNIVQDGITYTNTKYEEDEINIDEYWEDKKKYDYDWFDFETDFLHYFGCAEIKLWVFGDALNFLRSGYYKSTNDYVAFLQIFNELNLLPIKIYAGKSTENYYDFPDARKNDDIEFVLYWYGFNNEVVTYVKYSDALRNNLPRDRMHITNRVKELFFPKKENEYSENEKNELLIKFINQLET